MSLVKDVCIEAIRRMPEDITFEDIIDKILIIGHVLEGLKDIKDERTVTTEELLKRVEEWSKLSTH